MKAIYLSFLHMLKFIRKDMMLLVALTAPPLAGMAIRFVVPFAENKLMQFTESSAVISPYYGLFDIFFASLAPAMFCFIAAMVILEEHDEHIDRYLFITGLGRKGYIVSRIVIPAFFAFVITAALLPLFSLTDLSVGEIIFLSVTGTFQGIIIALLIAVLSSNKLEGMAVTKLSSLIIFGAAVPYFVPQPICFCFSFLPSFWMGKGIYENSPECLLPAFLTSCIWIILLYRKFCKKL